MRIRRQALKAMTAGAAAAALASGVLPTTTARADTTSPPPLSVAPAHPDPNNPVTRVYFVHAAAAGTTWTDEAVVENPGDTAVSALVYPVDGLTASQTGAVFSARTAPVSKAGAWIIPSTSSITVAAHGRVLVGFSVAVPATAAPGDHLGGIAVEEAQPRTGTGGSVSVTTVWRSVVGVLVQVPGDAAPFHLHIVGVSIGALPGAGTSGVSIDMYDDGQLLGKPDLDITVDGPDGYHKVFHRQLNTMLPGDHITYPLPVGDSLAPGEYTVSVGSFRQTVHLGASLPGSGSQEPAPIGPAAPAHGRAVVWVGVGGAGLLIMVASASVLLLRRRRRRRCTHCGAAMAAGRLIAVTHLDEMVACAPCAKAVHNDGSVSLCPRCYTDHVRRHLLRGSATPAARHREDASVR